MSVCTLGEVFQDVRGFLNDTGQLNSIPGGEIFTNAVLPTFFAEPYRTLFGRMQGASKRIQRIVYLILPASTSVLIPSTHGIEDFSEPEMIEERPQASPGLGITSTDTSTPILVTIPSHGFTVGGIVQGTISGIRGTTAPWGAWFATVLDSNTIALRGSASDGVAGTGGGWFPASFQPFTEVQPLDLAAEGLDGQPQQVLGVYEWINEQLIFRGASQDTQLRITYYASGSAPTNPNYTIGIDNSRDFLAKATAANAAAAKGWNDRARTLKLEAYGDPPTGEIGLLETFMAVQVMAAQRGPERRQLPFRDKRNRWGGGFLNG